MSDRKPPRSMGRLHIGTPEHQYGVFKVEMIFESTTGYIGQDEMESASRTIKQKFFELLHQNGFWDHGQIEVAMRQAGNGKAAVHFVIGCPVKKHDFTPLSLDAQRLRRDRIIAEAEDADAEE